MLFSLVAAAVPAELSVHVDGATDACTFTERVPAAVRRMLPGLTVTLDRGRAPSVPARGVALVITPKDGRIDLELVFDDPAIPATRRTLPSPPEACAATADGIALVVERQLRDLGWEPPSTPPRVDDPGEPGATTKPTHTATIGATTRPTSRTTTVDATATPREPPARTTTSTAPSSAPSGPPVALSIAARGAAYLGLDPNRSDGGATSRLTAGGALLVHVARGALEATAEVSIAPMGSEDIPRRDRIVGTISAWALAVMLRGGACLDLEPETPIALCAGAGGGVERFAASTTGAAIFRSRSASALAPILSAETRAELALTSRLHLTLDAGAVVRPTRTVFAIEGATASYRIPRTDLRAGLGVRVTIF
ncbi:hypothetical protein L6R52_37160 [Myxococcota bacterium]|nr:hypothetical protein [Myxococcota bacterium]